MVVVLGGYGGGGGFDKRGERESFCGEDGVCVCVCVLGWVGFR